VVQQALERLGRRRRVTGPAWFRRTCCDDSVGARSNQGLHAQAAPELCQPPEMAGEPGEARTQQNDLESGNLVNSPRRSRRWGRSPPGKPYGDCAANVLGLPVGSRAADRMRSEPARCRRAHRGSARRRSPKVTLSRRDRLTSLICEACSPVPALKVVLLSRDFTWLPPSWRSDKFWRGLRWRSLVDRAHRIVRTKFR